MAFIDDFNRADSTTVGNGWTEEVDASYEILSNKLRGYSGVNFPDSQLLRPVGEAFADGTVEVDFQFVTSTSGVPQVHGRCQGTNENTFYLVYVSGTTLYLAYNAGSFSNIDSAATGTLSVGVNYSIRLTMNGTAIGGELINLDTSTTLATVSATDATVAGSGRQAISTGAGGNPLDYDNFSAAEAAILKTVTDAGGGVDAAAASQTGLKTVTDTGSGSDGISLFVDISIADAGTGVESLDGPPMGDQLSLLERFDGTLAAWTLDQTGGTVTIQTVDNDEKMVLSDTSGTGMVSATRAVSAPNRTYLIEADMMAVGPAGAGRLEALDSLGATLFSVAVDSSTGLGSFDTDSSTPATFSWPADTYKQVVVVVDPVAGTARCFYTTFAGTTPSEWTPVGAAKPYTGAGITSIRFATESASTGDLRVDEVRVYRAELFCFGDSNTAGHAPSGPAWNPVPSASERTGATETETHSYPYRLGQKYAPAWWVANRGINADKSADADSRVTASVIDQGAKACAVLIGTNDILNGVPVSTTEANIASITTRLTSAGIDARLCSVPPSNGWSPAQNADRDTLNAWIEAHCTANGFSFADVYSAVRDAVDPDTIDPAYDAGDGLHFNDAGLQAIADTVFNAATPKPVSDVAAGADSVSISVQLAVAEAGGGTDATTLVLTVPVGDSAVGADSVVRAIFDAFPSIAEVSSAADSVSVRVTSGATSQEVYDLLQLVKSDVLTRLAASDYTAPDNASLAFVTKWVLNRLEVSSNVDGTESIKLYDDDDTTVLKTWSWDRFTKTRGKAK